MKSRLFLAALCALVLTLSSALVYAQEAASEEPREDDPLEADAEAEPEYTWDDYAVKGYAIEIFGGVFNGDRYLDLPVKGDRTQVEEGSDYVMGYDGTLWGPDELDYTIYDGPVKTLEDGYTLGVKVASYLTESFHVDLSLAYSSSEAQLTMVNSEDPENPVREEIDRDAGVQIFRGGLSATYDLRRFDLWGIYPYLGFGFGGVIVRYSALEDVGALYLVGTGGLKKHLFGGTSAFFQFDLTNYSMSRDELHYKKSITFTDLTFGLSFFIDTVPPEVRSLHEAEQEEASRRR